MTSTNSTQQDFDDYRDWVQSTSTQIRTQVNTLHRFGVTHGDLHPRNVLIDPDGLVHLVDYEMSTSTSDDTVASIGVAGFMAPDDRDGAARDLYAVACIELFMLVPLTPLLHLDKGKPQQLVQYAQSSFNLTPPRASELLSELEPTPSPKGPSTDSNPSGMVNAITAGLLLDVTPERTDRLWPGDPKQFSEAPYSLGHGALGIATALARIGVDCRVAELQWLRARVQSDAGSPLGLMNGLAGAVWAGRSLELGTLPGEIISTLRVQGWDHLDETLYAGIPGVALTLLSEAPSDPILASLAADMFTTVRDRIVTATARTRVATDRGGLFAGATGTALLALRLYEHFGDEQFIKAARQCLDIDLATLIEAPDGSLHVNEGWRIMPYLGHGSTGIGLVLAQYLQHHPTPEHYRGVLDRITRAACVPFAVQSGLTHGRAGLIYYLDEINQSGAGSEQSVAAATSHRRALPLNALVDGDVVRFAGNGLLRASCDLASGAAGVLTVLATSDPATARHIGPHPLAFLQRFDDATSPHLPAPSLNELVRG